MPRTLRRITAVPETARTVLVWIEPDPGGDPNRVRVGARGGAVAAMTVCGCRATCRPAGDGTFVDTVGVFG